MHAHQVNLSEWQREGEANEQQIKMFHRIWEAVKQHGSSLWSNPLLIKDRTAVIAEDRNIPIADQIQQAEEFLKTEIKAIFMLAGANKSQHDTWCTHLQDAFTVGRDE